MTAIGRLRERLVIEAPVETADGAGGVVRGYAPQATVWAEVMPVGARDDVVAAASGATVTHRITVRGGVAVTTRHRLRLGARRFEIATVRDADACGRFLRIEARERID